MNTKGVFRCAVCCVIDAAGCQRSDCPNRPELELKLPAGSISFEPDCSVCHGAGRTCGQPCVCTLRSQVHPNMALSSTPLLAALPGDDGAEIADIKVARGFRWNPVVFGLSQAARDVLAERHRQVDAEGWTHEHDDEHAKGDMARAAAVYAIVGSSDGRNVSDDGSSPSVIERIWPWAWSWFKPKDRRRNLVKAGALILAEIERIDRAVQADTRGGEA